MMIFSFCSKELTCSLPVRRDMGYLSELKYDLYVVAVTSVLQIICDIGPCYIVTGLYEPRSLFHNNAAHEGWHKCLLTLLHAVYENVLQWAFNFDDINKTFCTLGIRFYEKQMKICRCYFAAGKAGGTWKSYIMDKNDVPQWQLDYTCDECHVT